MFGSDGEEHTHHHGILAGLGAGTAAVLILGGLVLMSWHRISGAAGVAFLAVIWAVAAVVIAFAGYVVVFLGLRLRLHTRAPETLLIARPGRRQAQAAPVAPVLLPSQPVAGELPPGRGAGYPQGVAGQAWRPDR